jgi:drug/metabolite transporter (DMT)-like permease
MTSESIQTGAGATPENEQATGIVLIISAAVAWSFAGTVSRFIHVEDVWTIVFWRSLFAALFLLAFLILRDGPRGTVLLFRNMGIPGAVTGLCLGVTAIGYVVALHYTTVAKVVLFLATVPLMTALFSWLIFRQRISATTWAAIAIVIIGVTLMVWDSLSGPGSVIGLAAAFIIAVAFAASALMTRRYPHIRMMPAVVFGLFAATAVAAFPASYFLIPAREYGLIAIFGCFNLALGMAFFVTGARRLAPALTTLLATLETVLAPLWVALVHGEIPSRNTFIGGGLIIVALAFHLTLEWREQRKGRRIPAGPIPPPMP